MHAVSHAIIASVRSSFDSFMLDVLKGSFTPPLLPPITNQIGYEYMHFQELATMVNTAKNRMC
jgi:hypothetical protein